MARDKAYALVRIYASMVLSILCVRQMHCLHINVRILSVAYDAEALGLLSMACQMHTTASVVTFELLRQLSPHTQQELFSLQPGILHSLCKPGTRPSDTHTADLLRLALALQHLSETYYRYFWKRQPLSHLIGHLPTWILLRRQRYSQGLSQLSA